MLYLFDGICFVIIFSVYYLQVCEWTVMWYIMETQKHRNVSQIVFDFHNEQEGVGAGCCQWLVNLCKQKDDRDSVVSYRRNEKVLRCFIVFYFLIGMPLLLVACIFAKFYYEWGMIIMICFYVMETTVMSGVFWRTAYIMRKYHLFEW